MSRKGHGGLYKALTNKERRERKAKRREREVRSSLSILDLKGGKLLDSGKQEEGKTFHKLCSKCHVLLSQGIKTRQRCQHTTFTSSFVVPNEATQRVRADFF